MYTTPIKNILCFLWGLSINLLLIYKMAVCLQTQIYASFYFTGNLGGTLGLCIGASLLTFVEFFQFGFGLCVSAWSRRKQRKTAADANVKVVYPADRWVENQWFFILWMLASQMKMNDEKRIKNIFFSNWS